MIRIDILSQSPEEAVMRIAGWVRLPAEIDLVAQEGTRCLAQSRRLVLDLQEVLSLYEDGVALLQGWQAQGRLQICAWSYHIEDNLEHHGLIPPHKEDLE